LDSSTDKNYCSFFYCLIFLALLIIPPQSSFAQTHLTDSSYSSEQSYFYEPYPQKPGSYILQLGASFTLLPEPVVENEYPAPAIDLQYKRGIFNHFSLVGSLSTNYFTNLLHCGIQWNTTYKDFSVGIANHLGGFYGFISIEGQFDNNQAFAFFYLPVLRFGYRLDKYSVSMSWAVSYVIRSENKVSGLKAAGPSNKVNDYFCTLAIEQPFLKHAHLSIGFSLNFARSPYQSWLLFNTIDQYLFLPEFFFSIQL
jgi:hypothetical protein